MEEFKRYIKNLEDTIEEEITLFQKRYNVCVTKVNLLQEKNSTLKVEIEVKNEN